MPVCGSTKHFLNRLEYQIIQEGPEKIAAFVGFGQFVNGAKNEEISYQFTLDGAKQANDLDAIKQLEKVGPPVKGMYKGGFDGMMVQRNLMMKYGGYSKSEEKRFTRC